MRLSQLLLVSVIGLHSLPACAQDTPAPVPTPEQQMIGAVKRLLEQRPTDPNLHYFLASFQARAGERDNALASLRKAGELGEGFLPSTGFGFDALTDDPAYLAVYKELEAKLPVVSGAPVAFRLADKNFAPEGIAHDPVSGDFFIGSITTRQIVRVSPGGKQKPFSKPQDGLHQILGVAVDARRRMLYAVSTNAIVHGKPLRNAVVAYHIDSGKRVAVHEVPAARQLNDVAIAANGDLFASDSAAGAIYKIAGGTVTPFMAAGTLGGCNGLALSRDGATLYVAHSTGLARIDVASGKVDRMPAPPRQSVAAIDGLYVWNGDLIGIQNVTNPGRVIRVRLDQAGKEITAIDTLQSHHQPAFLQPTTGAIAGKHIYVLGTTQLPQYNEKGELTSGPPLKQPAIVKVPLL